MRKIADMGPRALDHVLVQPAEMSPGGADLDEPLEAGVIKVKHLYGAIDAGLVVNPALVENQIVGMLVQSTSRALIEEVRFSQTNVTSLDWNSYPVLRFADHPNVTPIVVQRMNERSTGAGVMPDV